MKSWQTRALQASAIGGLLFVIFVPACGTSNDGANNAAAGTTSQAASSSGGSATGAAPEASGGAPETAGGGAPNAGGADLGAAGSGPAVARFCNPLSHMNQSTTLILEIGDGADKVTFSAMTGTCMPADGMACTPIPVGPDVPVSLFDAISPDVALFANSATIEEGGQYVFFSDLDLNTGDPVWNGRRLAPGYACKDLTYAQLVQ